MVDVPKLRKLVEWVEEQDVLAESDRVWDQELWFHQDLPVIQAVENKYDPYCGTSMCAAGKLAFDAGWLPVIDGQGYIGDRATKDGVTKFYSEIGAEELGLNVADDYSPLFNASNTASDIRAIAEDYAGERL